MRTLFGRLAAVAVIAMLFSISVAVAAEGERPAAPKAPALAEADKPQPQMTQQERMKMCNQQAAKKSLKGDERRAFMSACLRRVRRHVRTASRARNSRGKVLAPVKK